MVAAVNKLAEDEPSPRRGKSRGKGRKRATIGRDGTATQILTDLKRQTVFREVDHIEVAAVSSATESADDPERQRLDNWLGEWCDIGYTKHVKTRKPLDPYRDRVEVDGELIQAPQRMKRVRLLEKNEKNRNFPVYELRPETSMNGYDWESRPDVPINDWSETGIARAKKVHLRQVNRSRERRQELGKDPVAPPRSSTLLRRPPDVMFFLHNPTGKLEGVWEEPWEHGIVDPSAAGKNRVHNRKSMEFMNNLRVEFFDQWILGARTIDPHDLETLEAEPSVIEEDPAGELESYAETLRTSKNRSASTRSEKGVDTGVMHGPEEKPAERFDWVHPNKSHQIVDLPDDSVIEGECEIVNEEVVNTDVNPEVLASDVLHPDFIRAKQEQLYVKEVQATAQAARDHRSKMIVWEICNQISQANMEIEEDHSMVPHCAARFQFMFPQMFIDMDMDDPRTVDAARKAVLGLGVAYRTLKKQIMELKVHQGGLAQWLAPDADINIDGLLDDDQITLEGERVYEIREMVERDIMPLPARHDLHNVANYSLMKEDYRQQERNTKWNDFVESTSKVEKRFSAARSARRARKNIERSRRQKLRDLTRRSYYYLYQVRRIHKPEERMYQQMMQVAPPVPVEPQLDTIEVRLARFIDRHLNALTEGLSKWSIRRAYNRSLRLRKPYKVHAIPEKAIKVEPVSADTDPQPAKEKPKAVPYTLRGKEKIPTGDYETRMGELQRQFNVLCGSPDSKDGDARGSPDEESGRDEGIIPRQYKSPKARKGLRGAVKRIKDRAQRSYRAA